MADFVSILNEGSLNGLLLFEDELTVLCGKLSLNFLILVNGINWLSFDQTGFLEIWFDEVLLPGVEPDFHSSAGVVTDEVPFL